jgi:putative ABC transport system permease protein
VSSGAAVGRLVGAELRGRRLRAMALLFVVVALSSAALVAGLETQTRAGDLWDGAFKAANGAHVTVHSQHASVLQAVVNDPRVAEASGPYRALDGGIEIRHGGDSDDVLVREMARGNRPDVARPLLRDGRWVRPGAADEIVIDRAYGIDRGVGVGDRIVLRQAGRDFRYTVVGRAVDLIDCFFPQCDPTPSWVDPAGFGRLDRHDVYGSEFLRLHDPEQTNAFVSDVATRYGDRAGTNDWQDTRDDALVISGFFGAFLSGFGVFVMLAAALVVLGAMASRVIARRRDIGLLKAVGVTPRQVTGSVLLAHMFVAALGVLAGWVLGGLLAGRLQLSTGRVIGGAGASFPLSRLLIAFVVIECIVVVSVVVPAWRAGRLSTSAALSSATVLRGRRSWLARLLLGPIGGAGVRDAFARPARSVFTVLALAVAIVAVVVSMGFNRTVDHAFADPASTGDPYDVIVAPHDGAAYRAHTARALDADRNVSSWFTTTEQTGLIDGASYLTRALGGDVARSGYVVESGRLPRADDEAIAGYGLLQAIGASVGDDVTVRIGGKDATFHLVGWYRDTEDTGQVLMFTLAGLHRVDPTAPADAFFAHVRDGVGVDAAAATLQRELEGTAQVTTNVTTDNPEIDAFRTTFWLFTALVLVVAFANLASTLLLAVRERTRDLGVLRSVGFTPRQVVGVTAVGAAVLAGIAVVVGVPAGWAVYRVLIRTVGTSAGISPNIGTNPTTLALVLLVPLAVLAAAALGAGVTRRAATAEVSDLVRYE